jgi:C_GCAxxG_C_C family probable redox protein
MNGANQKLEYSERALKAKAFFEQGYNCAQSVALAFCDETGLAPETAAKLASSFGAGMGRLREVCGAVSGALLTLGTALGYNDPKDYEAKKAHYALVQEFARRFKEKNGSIVCRELLRGAEVSTGSTPEQRTPEFYKKRPCPELIRQAAQITQQMLAEAGALPAKTKEEAE